MKQEPAYLVIPAAGLGTRMQGVNPGIPKEMLPLGSKPAIQYAVAEGLSAGIRNIIIIINPDKEIVRRYFEDRPFRQALFPRAAREMDELTGQCSITFLYQRQPLGESDAIGLAAEIVGNHCLAILYPDNVYFPSPGSLKFLRPFFVRYRQDITALMEVTGKNARGISNSGRVDLNCREKNIFRIERFYPKGPGFFVPRFPREFRTCGIALSGSHIFEYIQRLKPTVTDGEFTDGPLRSLMLKEKGLLGCLLPGHVFDIGNPEGYSQCLRFIGNVHE